uniref:PEPxxWA-CTERM sorting domain-containing protein n=1 Tax=Altererythrobacter segetis TaxID=1104773 RepID=UPI00140C919E|nr:PEPxxWA-CTERM sorting domain-containing protein [Altererythrobacter segetis]
MRAAYAVAAFAALWVQPASAATQVIFSVDGYVPSTEMIFYGQNPDTWPTSCAGQIFCETATSDYVQHTNWSWVPGSSDDGVYFTFDAFDAGPREGISGTARYVGNGSYEGLSLNYFVSPLGIGDGPWRVVNGQTSSFSIYQTLPAPVPEPATWAMLLLGFFTLAGALRGRTRVRSKAIYRHAY